VVLTTKDHNRLWQKYFWKNFTKKVKIFLAFIFKDEYYIKCCGVIAVKREVAASE